MQKAAARKILTARRKEISPVQKEKMDDLLLIQLQKLPLPYLSAVLSFYPLEKKKEINTFILTDYLAFKNPGLLVAYPKTDSTTQSMRALAVTEESTFVANAYNIFEPAAGEGIEPTALDAVLVPMLVCDKRGNRVGYGKGYYDRYLKGCRADCLKIGLSYFDPIDRLEDAAAHDVPLDICITPQQVYVF